MGGWTVRSGIISGFAIMAALASTVGSASADDLVMPFSCSLDRGEVRLSRANETVYRMVGGRQETPFTECVPGGRCETMMVHKFAIECDGGRAAWSRVAAAARPLGVSLPANLPSGFAPVSRLSARFVLPSLAVTAPSVDHVVRQDLSPDSVMDFYDHPFVHDAAWETVVKADFMPRSSVDAFKVAGVLATLLAGLMAVSLVAAGRWRPQFAFAGPYGRRMAERVEAVLTTVRDWTQVLSKDPGSKFEFRYGDDANAAGDTLAMQFAALHARVAETELVIAALPDDLLLKDVLLSEIATLHDRTVEAHEKRWRQPRGRSVAVLRGLNRDLERVTRIAHGAGRDAGVHHEGRSGPAAPASIFDAYRVLGINADAPAAAVKKLVDALRVTWHPDLARDETDRRNREERMKQINAAWDIIKAQRKAA